MKLSVTDFQHPWWLVLIVVPIALAAGYVIAQRSKRRRSIRFGNMPALRASRTDRRNWLVHVPAVALVPGLVALVIALGAPQAEQREERNRATVMLVMDVSLSMEATDVAPSRLEAAQIAAKVVGTVAEMRKRLGDLVKKDEVVAVLDSRDAVTVAGLEIAAAFFRRLDPGCRIELLAKDGDSVPAGTDLLLVEGNARALLAELQAQFAPRPLALAGLADQPQHGLGQHAQRVSQTAFLRNFARGEAYLQEAPTLWDVTFQTAVECATASL